MKDLLSTVFAFCLTAITAFAHVDAIKPYFLDNLVEPYLTIQKGLAADDLKATQTGAANFLIAMRFAPGEDGAHHDAHELSEPATKIVDADDLEAARRAFLVLTNDMLPLITHVGTTGKTPLYVAHCPMAFSNTGADWIQSDEAIANPYFGASMFSCGAIKQQVAVSK